MESVVTTVLLGVGLAMDCFAVSLAVGAFNPHKRGWYALVLGLFFGFFQFFMCALGWVLGAGFSAVIAAYDHWVAFFLLLVVGGKMIREGLEGDEDESLLGNLGLVTLTMLAVATSIDALAVGISFAVLDVLPLEPALTIGAVSLVFSVAGVLSGTKLEAILGRKTDILGGIILIAIGIRVLVEHSF
ncbi:MAG: manganese efflux pump [Methanomicrobiales archaeon]|nr:manganese efflux pump [Methanomicrobiales archaeon]